MKITHNMALNFHSITFDIFHEYMTIGDKILALRKDRKSFLFVFIILIGKPQMI